MKYLKKFSAMQSLLEQSNEGLNDNEVDIDTIWDISVKVISKDMKHLKRYNESLTPDEIDDLKEFCEMNLVYLMDEDFIVDIDSRFGTTGNVSFNLKRESGFTWDEIKDHFIPFLQRLSNKYVIIDRIMISFQGTGINETRVESLINNDIGTVLPSETLIRRIFIRIVDEK